MGIGLITLLSFASAEEVPWYVEHEISAVSVVNDRGFVPEGDLYRLLKTRVGESFQPEVVRADLSTLYTLGSFSKIEVDLLDESIDDNPVLHVRYRIQEAPRLSDIDVSAPTTLKQLVRQRFHIHVVSILSISEIQI